MIVTRGLGQARVLGIISAFGLGIGGAADVVVEPPIGGGQVFRPVYRRPIRADDEEVVLLLMGLFTSGAFDGETE